MEFIKAPISSKKISDIKNTILSPALTSHFSVKIVPPPDVIKFVDDENRIRGFTLDKLDELSLLCSEATLPGSSLFTNEVTGDFTGVTEKMVYRRQYDDQSSFTFYVDQDYNVIEFLEGWMNFIVNEDDQKKYLSENASYRMKFRDDYAGQIVITKFERNMGQVVNTGKTNEVSSNTSTRLDYNFIKAYPISIDSMPVSYENGTILKCTVNFTYIRYVRSRIYNSKTK
jgi:hypothetical protein